MEGFPQRIQHLVDCKDVSRKICGKKESGVAGVQEFQNGRHPKIVGALFSTFGAHHSITPSLHHSTTPPLHHSNTPSLHHSITPILHHSITPHSTTPTPELLNSCNS
jgi:hypothetical protein